MKSFKHLFIKDPDEASPPPGEAPVLPAGATSDSVSKTAALPVKKSSADNPFVAEIMEVYEQGLQSINMPGYDFFDFYNAVRAAGSDTAPVYKMAFQMGKTMDAALTSEKLVADADYYIGKIHEVHEGYAKQGHQKLDTLNTQQKADQDQLIQEAERQDADIKQLQQRITALQQAQKETRQRLEKIDEVYKPQQQDIQLKLGANDEAMKTCIRQLKTVRDSIHTHLK